jgi:spermidine/putrescine transport system substrate-binding protein
MKSKLMTLAAVGVLALGAGGCGADVKKDEGASSGADAKESTAPAPKTESGTLVISNWDAYLPKNLIPDFEKETGIKVKLAKHTTNEDIMGKLDAAGGKGYDLVFVSGQFAEALDKRGWAAPVDPAKVPNLSNLYPEAQKLGYDPGNKYSVPYTWGTTGICYRSDKVEGTPTSWNDLLKPKGDLKGKVTMLDTDRWLMLPALKVLGFSANTTDEGELKQARDLLLETKDDLLAYDSTTFYSKLVSGEAHLVEAWDGWCNYGIAENEDIKFVVPEEGSTCGSTRWWCSSPRRTRTRRTSSSTSCCGRRPARPWSTWSATRSRTPRRWRSCPRSWSSSSRTSRCRRPNCSRASRCRTWARPSRRGAAR